MSDTDHPPQPRFRSGPIDPQPIPDSPWSSRRLLTWRGELVRLQNRLEIFNGRGELLGEQGRYRVHQTVSLGSQKWVLLRKAATLAYESTRDFMGPDFCDTLSHWLRSVGRVYLYEPSQLSSKANTGLTEIPGDSTPVLHLVLYRNSDHPYARLENSRILTHEVGHVRDAHLDPLDELAEQIKGYFLKYHRMGVTDWLTRTALLQPEYEQLSWALESLNLGVDRVAPKVWRGHRPGLVRLVYGHRQEIAPIVSYGRRLSYNTEQIYTREHDMNLDQGTVLVERPPGVTRFPDGVTACHRPFRYYRFPTHPVIRGVLAWLRVQVMEALDSEVCRWDGFGWEFDRLKAGSHSDPDPGSIITPDNPDGFWLLQGLFAGGNQVSEVGRLLYQLDKDLDFLDEVAWDAIETDLGLPVSHRLYAQHCLNEINDEIERHERELKSREEAGYIATGEPPGY